MEELLTLKDYFKEIKKKIILNNYYTRKMKKGKTFKASLVDWIFLILILMIFFLITIYNSTRNIFMSGLITIIIMSFSISILIIWAKNRKKSKIVKIRDELATEQFTRQLDRYSNRDFISYIKKVVEDYYSTSLKEHDSNIDLIGEINGDTYGVKCIKSSLETRVIFKNIEYFVMAMEREGIEEGIIVTNTCFADEVKEQVDYLLIGFDQIKEMLLKMEDASFPGDEEVEGFIIDRYMKEREELKNNLSFSRRNKIYKFILLGIIFYLVSPIVSYPSYYRLAGILCISYGVIIGIYNLVIYFKDKKEVDTV